MPDNIYRKQGSKIWYFRTEVGGRERRESLRTTDRALAKKRAAARLEELNRAAWGDQRHTWKAAVLAWHQEGPELKPQTIRRYLTSIAAVDRILGHLYVDEIDKKMLVQIASRKGVTNATRKRDLNAVAVVLNSAAARCWLGDVPRIQPPKERRVPLSLPRGDEVVRLTGLLSPMLARLVRFLEHTGMRLEEAGGLRWSDVNLRRATATLTETKAGRVRVVPLNEAAVGTISGTPRHLDCPYIFWHSQDAPKRYSDLSGLLYDYRKRAGVPWRIHDLRHLFAVRYLQNGGSIYDLQKILGHSTIAVTERYLDHLTPAEQAVAKRTGS